MAQKSKGAVWPYLVAPPHEGEAVHCFTSGLPDCLKTSSPSLKVSKTTMHADLRGSPPNTDPRAGADSGRSECDSRQHHVEIEFHG